ncbi:hypothetical protein HMPREF2767_06360 [Nosocomiicoccus sp. HMSC067E10]|uniref:fumarylacetoacetate hydrolase family protein n=1 Tax=Nosocomiicoccus sp. HMSC067E10 TaxID=1739271 RepID=UPI0008A37FE1|nr:fumarylacetoacetate hydrolase family protein [Nosocomiicoccus sp. HMSC067E10]OFL49166.1 hypothetical protein HMPREF2767_06360 [Nosocomiicoccus sp. HMSC067E10]
MKFLSFTYKGNPTYGVKVKREDSAWSLPKLFEQFGEEKEYPKTLLEGITTYNTLDFQEIVRTLVEKAEADDNNHLYKAPFNEIEFLPPVAPPNNLICFGRNYKKHADELNNEVSLTVFTKANSSLVGDEGTIDSFSDVTEELDYEGELGIVIGKEAHNVQPHLALDYVYGYTIVNDITARDLQKSFKQFFLGKSLAAPVGPYIVTKDELPNLNNVSIVTKVNDEIRQDGNTRDMILSVEDIIAEVSKYVKLLPGDIIATGTPEGVAAGMEHPDFLESGDAVRVSINGIGTLTTYIK